MSLKKSNLKQTTVTQQIKSGPRPFVASHYIKPGFTQKQVLEAKQGFDLFDPAKTGYVQAAALKDAMVALGFGGKGSLMPQMIMDLADGSGTGFITFQDFVYILTAKISDFTTQQAWDRVFRAFDIDKSGSFSFKTLKAIIAQVGQQWDESVIRDMFDKADIDKDGLVRADEFYDVLTRKQQY